MKVENSVKRITEGRFHPEGFTKYSKQYFLFMALKDSREKRQRQKPAQGRKSKKKFLNSCDTRGPAFIAKVKLKIFP